MDRKSYFRMYIRIHLEKKIDFRFVGPFGVVLPGLFSSSPAKLLIHVVVFTEKAHAGPIDLRQPRLIRLAEFPF
jgi:hypothetical protein